MRYPNLLKTTLFALSVSAAALLQADPITPSYSTFGALPSATFGGSGIPNNAVAITTAQLGNGSVTLGLTAHQRYNNPVVTNDAAGTFYAVTGGDTYSTGYEQPGYARWNVGFYVDFNPNVDVGGSYTVDLYFDKNPAIGNSVTSSINLDFYGLITTGTLDGQNSLNLGMINYLPGAFDPFADGEYTFALVVSQAGTAGPIQVATSSIRVIVGNPTASVPDSGSTVAMLGLTLAGLGLVARRRRA